MGIPQISGQIDKENNCFSLENCIEVIQKDVLRIIQPLQRGNRLPTSESDVCRRQILTSKVDPHTVRVKIIVMP